MTRQGHKPTHTHANAPRTWGRRGPRQRKANVSARRWRANDLSDRYDRKDERLCAELAESRLGQRERERERRVSDADASYNAPASSTRTPKHVHSQRNHAKKPSLKKRPGPSPKGPAEKFSVDHRDRPKPDLMFSPPHQAA